MVSPAIAQPSPTTNQSADAAKPVEKLTAECLKVKGMVQWAPIGCKSTDAEAWKPVKLGGTYSDGIQIRTGLRSSVIFKFGDDTVAQVDRMTLAALSEFYRSGQRKRTLIDLDYGTVRAGVAETGALRSDFQINSPSATLSKRGTWGFEMWVERGTGRFSARLADRGLVEILQKSTGRRQQIRPQQWVNQAMMNWVETAKFERKVFVPDEISQTAEEVVAYVRTSTGRTGLAPANGGAGQGGPVNSGSLAAGMAANDRAASQQQQLLRSNQTLNVLSLSNALRGPRTIPSSDGDFGTGPAFGNSSSQKRILLRRLGALRRPAGANPYR
jgi:hypothetical protein